MIRVALFLCFSSVVQGEEIADLYSLSLRELMQIKITSNSLAETKLEDSPAAITHISHQDIVLSGARSLDELLQIYVPGLQLMRKRNGTALGIRGVISDRNDKYIMLVNGRVMNEHTDLGGISERFISLLGDIDTINVIRGPGSVVHGPGVIAGVIDITTIPGDTEKQGQWVQARLGAIEEFISLEYSIARRLANEGSVFFYFGVDNYSGADLSDAPIIFSHDFNSSFGPITAGRPVDAELRNEGEAYRNQARYKVHLQYQKEDLALWLRYTRGGEQMTASPADWRANRPTANVEKRGLGYQQITLMSDYHHKVNNAFNINVKLSYDMYDSERENGGSQPEHRSYREDEYYTRLLTTWTPHNAHTLSFGVDYRHEIYGLDSPGYPGEPAFIRPNIQAELSSWTTDTLSGLMEYQWQLRDNLIFHSGLRVDDSSNLQALNSSRLAMVYKPTNHDHVKLIYNRSLRIPVEQVLRKSELDQLDSAAIEKIDFYELRWEQQHRDDLWFALSSYYGDRDVTGGSSLSRTTEVLANITYYGIEFELIWQLPDFRFSFAHSFTQLLDSELANPALTSQAVTASVYGYGNDLANWSNHQSTLNMRYEFNAQTLMTASLMALWGYPGGQDLAEYNNDVLNNSLTLPIYSTEERAFEKSIFMNLGLQHNFDEQYTLRLDLFNILGWIDKYYNKQTLY
ncbi:MAG: TonB-dependent receptor plug domain-containing protein [Pseudomonadales bacterium]|nr:TonB-dependent receptor plug domain-containing protein [Pseudomonadales bacterium]